MEEENRQRSGTWEAGHRWYLEGAYSVYPSVILPLFLVSVCAVPLAVVGSSGSSGSPASMMVVYFCNKPG